MSHGFTKSVASLLVVTLLTVLLYAAGPYVAPPDVTVPANDVITAVGVPAMQANTGGTITAPGPVTATSNVVDLLANGGSINVTNGTLTSTSPNLSVGAADNSGTLTLSGGTASAASFGLVVQPPAPGTITATNLALTCGGPACVFFNSGAGGTVTIHGGSLTNGGGFAVQTMAPNQSVNIDQNATVTAQTGYGLYALTGGRITVDSVTVNTLATSGWALLAGDMEGGTVSHGSHITGNNVTVITMGDAGHGAYAPGGTIDLTNSRITTNGTAAYPLHVTNEQGPSTINATDTQVTENGGGSPILGSAFGLLADASFTPTPVLMNLTRGRVTVADPSATAGVSFWTGAAITANGTTITSLATGIRSDDGGSFITNNAIINAQGPGVIVRTRQNPPAINVMKLTGGQLTAGGEAFRSEGNSGGSIDVTGVTVTNGPLVLHSIVNSGGIPGAVTLNATTETLTGDVLADPGNIANVNLTASTLTGKATNGGAFTVNSASTWNVTGSSDVGSLNNANLVAFTVSAPFSTLTVRGSLTNSSRIGLNTTLGADSSPSDVLVINSGPVNGVGTLHITNRGGAGALTTGDGILVVRSATANTAGAFVLDGGTVTAGGFSYTLRRGARTPNPATDNNWYLVSTALPTIQLTGGSPQTTVIFTAFGQALEATVKDSNGNPVSGMTVTFTVPASGASATLSSPTAVTDANGHARVTATANGTVGTYNVTATAAGATGTATFALTNTTSPTIQLTGGSPQTTVIFTAFGQALEATVKDSNGNPVSGMTVTFTVPASGASATLSSATAVTDANGHARVTATANGTVGTYNVTATAAGATGTATFALTNTTSTSAEAVPATTMPVLILAGMALIGMVVWLRRRAAYPG
jgi:hypothetical protein